MAIVRESGVPEEDGKAAGAAGGKKIGILVVTYNAVTTLPKVLRRIPADVWEQISEVLVFDDASSDNTFELGVGLQATAFGEKLRVLRHEKNQGYGGNQKAGYRYFIEKGFDVVVLLHGDGQYAPELLSKVYGPIVAGEADAVFGSRMMAEHGGPLKGGMPLYKYAGNKILTRFENAQLGMKLTEFHSGYRAYSLAALAKIDFTHMTDLFHFDTEIIIKLHHQGYRIKEVSIPTNYGGEICRVNGMRYAKDVVRSVLRYKKTLASGRAYREFQEYFVRNPIKESRYSSHEYFLRLAGVNQRVLDLGCGEGFMAEKLGKNGNRVTGVDVLERPKLAGAFEKYVSASLERGLEAAEEGLRDETFDKILLMDILEHLTDPGKLLRDCQGHLKPQGQLIVSVPNVANVSVRLGLLFGRFNYAERGILDQTHYRFFTRKSVRRLVESCGYEVVRADMTIIPIELVLGISAKGRVMRFLSGLLAMLTAMLPGLLGYQCLLVLRPKSGASAGGR